MEWTPWIERRRPVEADALRILTVVHQLGRPVRGGGFAARLDGERRLQRLDHLVRHPVDLAFALMLGAPDGPAAGRRRSLLARQVRSLLPASPEETRRSAVIHSFDHGSWERWDDVWAYLGCRNLLRVRPHGDPPAKLSYLLTGEAAARLESLYRSEKSLAPYLERCRILDRHLPRPGRRSQGALDLDLAALARRLEAYRRQQRLGAEEDLLSRLFQTTFGEPL